jgi:hypothetical protein
MKRGSAIMKLKLYVFSVFGLETSDRWKYPLLLYVDENVMLRKAYLGIRREALDAVSTRSFVRNYGLWRIQVGE